jgi:hypothetical protein
MPSSDSSSAAGARSAIVRIEFAGDISAQLQICFLLCTSSIVYNDFFSAKFKDLSIIFSAYISL